MLPEIATTRLKLSPFTLDDVDELDQIWIHPDLRKYLCDERSVSARTINPNWFR